MSTFIGQPIGWYQADQGAGFVAATIGAVLVLFVWNRLGVNRTINDPDQFASSNMRFASGANLILASYGGTL